jgi:hypothetical protein
MRELKAGWQRVGWAKAATMFRLRHGFHSAVPTQFYRAQNLDSVGTAERIACQQGNASAAFAHPTPDQTEFTQTSA